MEERNNVFYPVRKQAENPAGILEKHGVDTARLNSE
jgi:hypothetical protein